MPRIFRIRFLSSALHIVICYVSQILRAVFFSQGLGEHRNMCCAIFDFDRQHPGDLVLLHKQHGQKQDRRLTFVPCTKSARTKLWTDQNNPRPTVNPSRVFYAYEVIDWMYTLCLSFTISEVFYTVKFCMHVSVYNAQNTLSSWKHGLLNVYKWTCLS